MTKTCYRCKQPQPLKLFGKKSKSKDGLTSICKPCKKIEDKEYREANKERLAAQNKERFATNKDTYNRNRRAKYHSATPEEVEERIRKKREYNTNAPEEVKERKRQYDKAYWASRKGREVARYHKHKRRALELSTDDSTITSQALDALKEEQEHKCKYCQCDLDYSSKGEVHLDHVIPLTKGGPHSITNVVWSCAICNKRKSDRDLEDFMQIYS